jgi:hypothetical protein
LPSLPTARLVTTAKSRSQPSSWLDDVRSFSGQSGQVSGLVLLARRLGHDFELRHRSCAMAVRRADAIGAGIAAADHDDMLALGGDRAARRRRLLGRPQRACSAASGNPWRSERRRARGPGSAGRAASRRRRPEHNRSIIVEQALDRHVDADMHARVKITPSAFHLAHALVDVVLFHLEVGDAIAQQAADAIRLLEQGARVAGARELLGAGQAGRARAHDGDALAGPRGAVCGLIQPSSQPRSTISHSIVLIDTGIVVDVQRARSLAGAGQMRPVNSGKLLVECRLSSAFSQSIAIDEVVPVRDLVVHRAARQQSPCPGRTECRNPCNARPVCGSALSMRLRNSE